MSIALLFPGQGAQSPGFLHALQDCSAVRDTMTDASEFLGQDVLELDSAEALESTVATQLSLLTAGVAFGRFLQQVDVPVIAAAGMSVGIFAAAVAAGCIHFRDALSLVRLRAQLMDQAFPGSTHGMATVEGLLRGDVQKLIQDTGVTLANDNAPLQFVVAGPVSALDAFCAKALAYGAHKATRLRMSVPSHGEWLCPAAEVLDQAIAEVPLHAPRLLLLANRNARSINSPQHLRLELAGNMAAPVLWRDIVTALEARAIDLYLEAPPGHVLGGLMRVNGSDAEVLSAAEIRWDVILKAARRSSV